MRPTPVRLPFSFAVATLLIAVLLLAAVAWAGDPVPDVDVVLEQIPGGSVKVESPTGRFDEIVLVVGKDFAKALRVTSLPPGWSLENKGKTVHLTGPAVPAGQPVRFKLDAGTAPRPQKISYQVKLEGRTLLERKNQAVELVPPRQVIGSLQGVVTVPSQVAPGEPMQMRVTDTAALPPGGTWRLTGTVVDQEEQEQPEEDSPDEPVVVTFTSDGEAHFADPRLAEELAVGRERIVRFAARFAPSIPPGTSIRLTIAPDGTLDWVPSDAAPPAETAESLLIDEETASGARRGEDIARAIPVCRWWRPIPPQCRILKPKKPKCPNGFPPDQCTHFVTAFAAADGAIDLMLPDDLAPGGVIALQYVDLYGDVLLDVPSVPGVEVVEPAGDDATARITDVTPRTSAGQTACVCGLFPSPEAWNALLLDGEALGPPVSASSRMAWVQLPAGLAPGPHVVSGLPEPGFPVDDRATVEIVAIGGEVDSSKLQRLETTPMRLWVEGTSRPVDLRVRNKTPTIISIDGGDDQVIRTSGGEPNQLERTVRGLSPGPFDVGFELVGEGCPCASAETHYW